MAVCEYTQDKVKSRLWRANESDPISQNKKVVKVKHPAEPFKGFDPTRGARFSLIQDAR